MFRQSQLLAAPAALSLLFTVSPFAAAADAPDVDSFSFNMVISTGAKPCLPAATATVTITPVGPVEIMDVSVQGLPPKTEFDLFVIQVPKAPFGISWYQGDIVTDKNGRRMARILDLPESAMVPCRSSVLAIMSFEDPESA